MRVSLSFNLCLFIFSGPHVLRYLQKWSLILSLFIPLVSYASIDFAGIEKGVVTIYQVDINSNIVAQGTGFFIDSVTVITNFHVVFDKRQPDVLYSTKGVRIELHSGEIIYPTSLKYDSIRDIAVLHIENSQKQKCFLQISKRKPKVGDIVWTIGNPLGLTNTWSNGIVSSKRQSNAKDTIYQFTASISPGSSGGPVLNDVGQVIGISTFKLMNGENLNFFIDIAALAFAKSYFYFTLNDEEFQIGNTVSNYVSLAKAATSKHDYKLALLYLNEAVKIDTSNSDIYKAKAQNLIELNDFKSAAECIRRAEAHSGLYKVVDLELPNLWGMLHEKQGRFLDAAKDYLEWSRRISYYRDDSIEVYMQWGYLRAAYCYKEAEDYINARLYIEKVTEGEYMNFNFYHLRSSIYMYLSKDGDTTITKEMICSDLMKVKSMLENVSNFQDYQTVKEIFDEICK